MDSVVESALISAAATVFSVGGTVIVAYLGFRFSRTTNQATIDAARATTAETVDAAREANRTSIEAAHKDVHSTLDTTRDGQFADRYSRAIEQLGSDNMDIRIGGIYALEGIAHDSAGHHPTVMEVLAAFIRDHSHEQWPSSDRDSGEQVRSARPDVQAALTVIGRRDSKRDIRQIDLTGASLSGASLRGAHLTHVNLSGSAYLVGADLTDADLTDADLTDAFLTEANLTGANLSRADLTRANFADADLTGANLSRAHLTNAILTSATLTRATYATADLTGVRWPEDVQVPDGWVPELGSGRLEAAGTDSEPADAD
jgi:hypothetical protein